MGYHQNYRQILVKLFICFIKFSIQLRFIFAARPVLKNDRRYTELITNSNRKLFIALNHMKRSCVEN